MTKFFTRMTRAGNQFVVTVLAHDLDVSSCATSNGYPGSNERTVLSRKFATKRSALLWAVEQPAALSIRA